MLLYTRETGPLSIAKIGYYLCRLTLERSYRDMSSLPASNDNPAVHEFLFVP